MGRTAKRARKRAAKDAASIAWEFAPHRPGSDYYGDTRHPGHTIWPQGSCVAGLSRTEARRLQVSVNAFMGMDNVCLAKFKKPGSVQVLVDERNALKEALRLATVSLRDLKNDWPHHELHEPLEETIERGLKLMPEVAAEIG